MAVPSDAEADAAARAVRLWRAAWGRSGARSCLLLASTFRSGSTFVAEVLHANGLPDMRLEYFADAWAHRGGARPPEATESFFAEIFATHRDGRFGAKLMWPHRTFLAQAFGLGRERAREFAALFPDARWIHVRRGDKVAQAISFWRAKQTGRWHVFSEGPEPVPGYDLAGILACLHEIQLHDALWDDFFALAGMRPVTVVYERFDHATADEARRVFSELGLAAPRSIEVAARQRRQADAATARIRKRLLGDLHLR